MRFIHAWKSPNFNSYLFSLIIWTFKSLHMASISRCGPQWCDTVKRGRYTVRRVLRVRRVRRVLRVRSVYAAVIPSRCAGRRRQRLTLPAVERPRASSEVSPASEVLECWVGITGDELGVRRGENQLLIFPFDTHQLPLTDTGRLTDFKDGQSTKDKPGGWKVWMKRNEGIYLDILRNFLLQMQKQFYNISFPYKENSSALQPRSLAGNRTMLHLLLEGSGNVATLLEHEKSELDRISDGNIARNNNMSTFILVPYKPDFD